MKKITFEGMTAEVPDDEFKQDVFDVDFSGCMMVQFTRQEDGTIKPTNGMNGWGQNIADEIANSEPIIEEL